MIKLSRPWIQYNDILYYQSMECTFKSCFYFVFHYLAYMGVSVHLSICMSHNTLLHLSRKPLTQFLVLTLFSFIESIRFWKYCILRFTHPSLCHTFLHISEELLIKLWLHILLLILILDFSIRCWYVTAINVCLIPIALIMNLQPWLVMYVTDILVCLVCLFFYVS